MADRTRVMLRSLRPNDRSSYVVVGGNDFLSNILAVTYDPEKKIVYWADSGRKMIGRKFLSANDDISDNVEESIYTDIGF